jgi:hypothetical protein
VRGRPPCRRDDDDSYCYQLEQNLNQQRIAIERKQLNDFFQLMMNFTRSSRKLPIVSLPGIRLKTSKRPWIVCAI